MGRRTGTTIDVWLGLLAAVLSLNDNALLPCSLSRACKKLVITGRTAAAQTGHIDFVVRYAESFGYFFFASGEMSAHLYVSQASHLYVHYDSA